MFILRFLGRALFTLAVLVVLVVEIGRAHV